MAEPPSLVPGRLLCPWLDGGPTVKRERVEPEPEPVPEPEPEFEHYFKFRACPI